MSSTNYLFILIVRCLVTWHKTHTRKAALCFSIFNVMLWLPLCNSRPVSSPLKEIFYPLVIIFYIPHLYPDYCMATNIFSISKIWVSFIYHLLPTRMLSVLENSNACWYWCWIFIYGGTTQIYHILYIYLSGARHLRFHFGATVNNITVNMHVPIFVEHVFISLWYMSCSLSWLKGFSWMGAHHIFLCVWC